jgi:hypothetical protein
MHISATGRRIAAFGLAVATLGCASLSHRPSFRETSCYPRDCFLDVQNDNGLSIAVRYFDSTGAGDVLGLVFPVTVRRFALTRRTSRAVTIEVKRERQVYRSQPKLLVPQYENLIHFPADFDLVSGPLAEVRR